MPRGVTPPVLQTHGPSGTFWDTQLCLDRVAVLPRSLSELQPPAL